MGELTTYDKIMAAREFLANAVSADAEMIPTFVVVDLLWKFADQQAKPPTGYMMPPSTIVLSWSEDHKWQPIATAPKDRTRILGWTGDSNFPDQIIWWLQDPEHWARALDGVMVNPLYWMPLPKGPNTNGK